MVYVRWSYDQKSRLSPGAENLGVMCKLHSGSPSVVAAKLPHISCQFIGDMKCFMQI